MYQRPGHIFLSPDELLRVPGRLHQRLHLVGGKLALDKALMPLGRFPPRKYLRFVRRHILQNIFQNFCLHLNLYHRRMFQVFKSLFMSCNSCIEETSENTFVRLFTPFFFKILHQYWIATALIVYTFSGNMFIVFEHIVD